MSTVINLLGLCVIRLKWSRHKRDTMGWYNNNKKQTKLKKNRVKQTPVMSDEWWMDDIALDSSHFHSASITNTGFVVRETCRSKQHQEEGRDLIWQKNRTRGVETWRNKFEVTRKRSDPENENLLSGFPVHTVKVVQCIPDNKWLIKR